MITVAVSTKQNSKQWKGGTECNLARRVEGACINNGARLGFGLAVVSGGACPRAMYGRLSWCGLPA